MSRFAYFALSLSLISTPALAQGDAMIELYGEGVHRYFCSDYSEAEEILSQVVDSGSQDPRAHYFLGLARYMQGRAPEAEANFRDGARVEAEGKLVVAVGSALTRIQGQVRSKIERARRDARVVALQQQAIRQRAKMQAAGVPGPSATTPPQPNETVGSNPFSDGEGLRSGDVTVDPVQPGEPEIDAAANPFSDDVPPAATTPDAPPATDPFETPADPSGGAGNPFETPPAGDPGSTPPDFNPFDPPAGSTPADDADTSNPFNF